MGNPHAALHAVAASPHAAMPNATDCSPSWDVPSKSVALEEAFEHQHMLLTHTARSSAKYIGPTQCCKQSQYQESYLDATVHSLEGHWTILLMTNASVAF